jgi:sec-independent protein translocase protein TatA
MEVHMQRIGIIEILVVLLIVLVLFGAKRLPELARGIGKSLSELRKGMKDESQDESSEKKPDLKG